MVFHVRSPLIIWWSNRWFLGTQNHPSFPFSKNQIPKSFPKPISGGIQDIWNSSLKVLLFKSFLGFYPIQGGPLPIVINGVSYNPNKWPEMNWFAWGYVITTITLVFQNPPVIPCEDRCERNPCLRLLLRRCLGVQTPILIRYDWKTRVKMELQRPLLITGLPTHLYELVGHPNLGGWQSRNLPPKMSETFGFRSYRKFCPES